MTRTMSLPRGVGWFKVVDSGQTQETPYDRSRVPNRPVEADGKASREGGQRLGYRLAHSRAADRSATVAAVAPGPTADTTAHNQLFSLFSNSRAGVDSLTRTLRREK